MPDLFVIEAPGKAQGFEKALRSLGTDARVQATKGHLYAMPDTLDPVGIDKNMHEYMRAPRDIKVVRRLRDEARQADRVFIATDADQEGDVIAWDVYKLIEDIHSEAYRVRLKGMDQESIAEAIQAATTVSELDAVPGRTRAIVDRLIGATFSKDGVAVGRVSTALLGLVAEMKSSPLKLILSAPAKDGGRPWIAETQVKPPLSADIARRLGDIALPAIDFAKSTFQQGRPGHMGDIMVRAGDVLDMSPTEAATDLQSLYETGRLSYPRSGSRGMSKSVSDRLAKIFRQANVRFKQVSEKSDSEVHDAPYPIGKIDVTNDPERMGTEEGLRTLIGRDLAKAGTTRKVEKADATPLRQFLISEGFSEPVAQFVVSLDWRRDMGPRYPGQESWAESRVIQRRPDTVLLEAAIEAGLGRPSTWARHVDAFMTRGLVDNNLNLTAKGKAWIAASPEELLDVRMSAAIERACETTALSNSSTKAAPWETLAGRIVTALPGRLKDAVAKTTATTGARSRRDYSADAQLADVGLTDKPQTEAVRHDYSYTPDT